MNVFLSEVQGMSKVPAVDAEVACNCPITLEIYLLVMQNDFHIPSMKHNLIPLFILREAGLTVSEVPNTHCDDPKVEYHLIYDDVTKLQIPLKSYFPKQALTLDDIQRCDEMKHVFLSPDAETWDTYFETYDLNKEQLVDDGGDILN